MAKKHTQKRKYAGEFRERSFRKPKTLRLHIRQDHENKSDDEGHEMEVTDDDKNHDENEGDEDDKDQREHDAEDAEVVEGLGNVNEDNELSDLDVRKQGRKMPLHFVCLLEDHCENMKHENNIETFLCRSLDNKNFW